MLLFSKFLIVEGARYAKARVAEYPLEDGVGFPLSGLIV